VGFGLYIQFFNSVINDDEILFEQHFKRIYFNPWLVGKPTHS